MFPGAVACGVSTGAWILVVAVVAAVAFGSYRRVSDGRFGGGTQAESTAQPLVTPAAQVVTDVGAHLGSRATLLQFSSAFCAPCRATRRTLAEVAELVDGVVHVEVDAEEHLELTRRLDILRTPTTLVLDASGREVSRAAGAPTKDHVFSALARVES